MGILGGLGFAAIFYAAAEYEHMTGWKWALASLALSATVKGLFALSFIFVLPAQFGLFVVLAWMNIRRKAEMEVDRAASAEEDRRRRQERARLAQQQVDPDRAAREAAREAAEHAALRERQERVKRAREEREREEREQAEKG
jgi:flagellar biosynthesis GTPase FlhF